MITDSKTAVVILVVMLQSLTMYLPLSKEVMVEAEEVMVEEEDAAELAGHGLRNSARSAMLPINHRRSTPPITLSIALS